MAENINLESPIESLSGVGPVFVNKLKKLGISTVEDLVFHFPSRHVDFSNKVSIRDLEIDEPVTITGQVISIKNVYTKTGKFLQTAVISDGEETVEAIWMRQPYLPRRIPAGTYISLSGKLTFWGNKKAFAFPQYEKFTGEYVNTGGLIPVYPETAGITSKWLRARIAQLINKIEVDDFISKKDLSDLNLMDRHSAVVKIHKPQTENDQRLARERLAFDEVLMLQITSHLRKLWWRENTKTHKLVVNETNISEFFGSLPFELTNSQSKSILEIYKDMSGGLPMNRLLQGDVGSGKTAVAGAGAFAAFINNKKTVLLAPTQILAQQHYETINKLLSPFGVEVALVTSDKATQSAQTADVVVGTHALLFKASIVESAAFVVIDEQHRFGVKQRGKIAKIATKAKEVPHVLTMTATPIPRSVALTLYGDLALSTLDELPRGRQKITTWVVPPEKRLGAEKWIRDQIIEHGSQAFVVCPFIEESAVDTLKEVKAATIEYERLRGVFSELSVGLLHGRMSAEEKNKILDDFKSKKYDILVSTPVIEVGIDIPNATIMVIEGAERFGLASLYQLRGRVGRGEKKSYCLLFSESRSKKVKDRLKAVARATSGRELAEIDLKTRGPGEILGLKQHGVPELKIARWDDMVLFKKARDYAQKVVHDQTSHASVIAHYRKMQKARN